MRDLLVDLSNACRDERLGGGEVADWARLDRLIATWLRDINPDTDFYFIADDSLSGHFRASQDLMRWKHMRTQGILESVPHADTRVLALALKTGASVLSCDRFMAHRRDFPWVDDDQQHFWDWTTNSQHEVLIQRRAMGHFPAADLTRAEEQSALRH